ncbi:PEGA domain-containing protein [Polyangium sorediatum]|uniref:PEGA domain-containing protein n=1 Tax=Polyangium sorediatum TaxID=889274 RepID=A0ABT6P389_9BACT|nr:PEGA domain-containing protein [Polyangium sorediatum]MDI1434986.1 PEGA domain-containing protein [Polyangium sorediatum]
MSHRRHRTRFSIFLAAVLAASCLGPTLAAPSAVAAPAAEVARAAELKSQGDDHMRVKRYEDALRAYDEAYALAKDPVLQYNRGRALQFLARYPEALAAFRKFEADALPAVRAKVPTLKDIIAEVRGKVALLRVQCDVEGARVLLGKREIGTTPVDAALPVNAGRATLEILADGYLPFSREVDLSGDEAENAVEAKLQAKSRVGLLVVKSRVTGARAEVDGKAIGVVPAEASLGAGKHDVEVFRDGYDAARTQVVIVAGERKELSLDPLASTPIYKKWWFWTAAGVVVAGAVVTAVVVTTERAAPTGSFSPGQIRF